ncbi:MAG: superoxide dismutase [Deltaproteobacteria bacterium]|nr:MAG: superoxide dismutase [Deltaproteobacteria bacterium]
MKVQNYEVKKYHLSGLKGISDKTLEMHFKLYEGYVKETNRLSSEVDHMLGNGKVNHEEMPAYSELKRRLGFEYNGMVLHEYYFENLKPSGGELSRKSAFFKKIEEEFGSFDTWKADFVSVGSMRGVGWAICYEDPNNSRISNHWVTLHEIGNVAGFKPILVMDMWEHAFLLDYKPSEKNKYIEAFFSNVNWKIVETRFGI